MNSPNASITLPAASGPVCPSFKTILQKVHEAYADQRLKIIEQKKLINMSQKLFGLIISVASLAKL